MIHLMVIDPSNRPRQHRRRGVATLADVHAAPRLVAYSDLPLPRLRELKVFLCATSSIATTRCCA